MLAAINPEAKQDIIGLGNVDSMLAVQQHLDRGYLVGMLADRTPADDALYPVSFSGCHRQPADRSFSHGRAVAPQGIFHDRAFIWRKSLQHPISICWLIFSNIAAGQRKAAIEAAITRYAELLEAVLPCGTL